MITPLPVANALLVLMSVLWAMSLLTGMFVVQALLGVFLAGQLVGRATKA